MTIAPRTPTERVAYVVWRLAHGQRFTTAQIAAEVGITESGVRKMMVDVAHICPVFRNDAGEWVWMMIEALEEW